MKRTKLFSLSIVSILALTGAIVSPQGASALTITSTVECGDNPSRTIYPNTAINGDCTIGGNSIERLVGDGADEWTVWDFNFTEDVGFSSFLDVVNSGRSLESALLTLTAIPKDRLITGDVVRIQGLPRLRLTDITEIPPLHQPFTFSIDLLTTTANPYTSEQILDKFTDPSHTGVLSMHYQDDAIISSAKLELKTTPEPSFLFGLLGVSVLGVWKQKMK